ncbi:MAG: glycosyl hydrolase [Campylobacterales bacterium]|nr:glycosyl hydrolase [Campylobacterales bacterium]
MNNQVNWDPHSDQPYVDRDPVKKKKARLSQWDEMIKIVLLAFVFYPLGYLYGLIFQKISKRKKIKVENFFGIAVNLDKYPKETPELINELEVETLTVRVPLWEIEKIEHYENFIKSLKCKDLIVVLMQSRDLVEDEKKLEEVLKIVFKTLTPYTKKFQFGVAINRYKWGYYTPNEYLSNLEVVERVKKDFDIQLIGSSVIDFEYLLTIRTLFNFFKFKFDSVSSLLYVDRRGAPENTQMGLNLVGKIEFLFFLVKSSFKSRSNKIYITETNWPLKDSDKYSPTSNDECIEEDLQTKYVVRYYLLALGTEKVRSVYWHQLFSPGFGLIDFRDGIRKRDSFFAFKFMNKTLNSSALERTETGDLYRYTFKKEEKKILVVWSFNKEKIEKDPKYNYYNILGKIIEEDGFILGDSPIYMIEK